MTWGKYPANHSPKTPNPPAGWGLGYSGCVSSSGGLWGLGFLNPGSTSVWEHSSFLPDYRC